MENQSRTPNKSTNFIEKWGESIKDNLNYISIALMMLTNILLSLLRIANGSIGLNYPSTTLGWILWASKIALSTFMGVMILNFFRRQGIKNGHKKIQDTYDNYIKAITNNTKEAKPRTLKQYLRKSARKDTLSKVFILTSTSLVVGSLLVGANINNMLSLIINIILAIGFGIKTMIEAEDYVCTELIIWYKQEIEKLKKEGKEDVRNNISRNDCELGLAESSGVQQEKECNAGLTDSEYNSEC